VRDWEPEVDRWLERFRDEEDPPAQFRRALAEGWAPGEREALAIAAADRERQTAAYLAQLREAGVELVRLDCKSETCSVCVKYCGAPFSLEEDSDLPPPPPMPICPACTHVLSMLTPFFMQRSGLSREDLADRAQPFVD